MADNSAGLFNTKVGGLYKPSRFSGSQVPSYTGGGANQYQAGINKGLGTTFGNQQGLVGNNYMYTDPTSGMQMQTGDLSGNQQAMDYFKANPESGRSKLGGYAGLADSAINAFNAYNQYTLGNKNLGLARDKFAFEKAAANANLVNQARLANNQIQNAGEVGMGLAGNTMDANARAARQAQMDSMKLSTAPIG